MAGDSENEEAWAADRVNRLRGAEGGLTLSYKGKLRAAQILADRMEQEEVLAQSTVRELQGAKDNLRTASSKLEACLKDLMATFDRDADKNAYEEKINKLIDDSSTQTARISVCLNKYEKQQLDTLALQAQQPPPPAPPAAPAQPQASRRIDDSLKPKVLSLQDQPDEYREWTRGLQAWFAFNKMDTLALQLQHSLLRTVIDAELKTHLTNNTTPQSTFNECVAVIKSEFDKCYPIHQKRLTFFRTTHDRGEAFSTCLEKIKRRGVEGDINAMTGDELHAFVAVKACNNDKLRDRLLRLQTITMETITTETRAFESQQTIKQSIDEPDGRAAAVYERTECYRCGSPRHDATACPSESRLYCGYCNLKGHMERVCRRKSYERRRSPSREDSRGRTNWRARTPERKQSPDAKNVYDRGRRGSEANRNRSASPWRGQSPAPYRRRDSRSPRRGQSPGRRRPSQDRGRANMVSDPEPDKESEDEDSDDGRRPQ